MIPAYYQNDLQMFPIFRMQFASLKDIVYGSQIQCEKMGSESKYFWVRQLRRGFPELSMTNTPPFKCFFFQEICQRPKFIAEGATRFDVEQGENGDPWLLAAVSSLTLTPRFLDRSAH